MRSKFVAVAVVVAIAPAPAQGVVNPSLLHAPEVNAPPVGPAAIVAAAGAALVHVEILVQGERGEFPIVRSSSGVVIDKGGLVLTWRHLVQEVPGANDKKLLVQLNDAANTQLPATIERLDDSLGLALLRVKPPEAGLTAVEFGADRPRHGESVLVIARPEGKEVLAFAGVASPALAGVSHRGIALAAERFFLTDTRNDERCDGGPVLDADGRLLGLYSSEHVQRDQSEPTLADLRQPSFGIVLPAGELRRAFAAEFGKPGLANATLTKAPPAPASPRAAAVAAAAASLVGVWGGDGEWPALGDRDPGAVQRRDGLGSGVVLTKDGLVVTNAHLVGRDDVHVRVGAATYPAKVQKRQGATNLALLQVELPAGVELVPPNFAPDEPPALGETVLALGRPLGTDVVVTGGVVSAFRGWSGTRVQADPNLGNQNGGGAVVDLTGRVVGIGDGGAEDPLEWAFKRLGDHLTTETNLSTFVSVAGLRRAFGKAFAERVAGTSLAAPAAATDADRALRHTPLTAMVEKASKASLNIVLSRNMAEGKPDDLFPPEPVWIPFSLGSGVVIDRSGLALSNWHVVDDATNPDGSPTDRFKVQASVFGGKTYDVKVLSISRENDLSLLQLELAPGEELQAVELGNSDALRVGERVAALGNPLGAENTITYGVVSAKGQAIRVKGRHAKLGPLLETDAAINGGNSGGALLDMQGRLVGINSAGGGTFNNKGYAIEVDHVRTTVTGLLLQAYKLRSPDLGIEVLDDEGFVVIAKVDERGPGARAGLKTGDRVVALAGTDITWSPGFARTLAALPADAETEIRVVRGGATVAQRIAPVSAAVWSVIRQSNLECRTLGTREDFDRVRAAAIALHRYVTKDPTGEPSEIPEFVVRIDRVYEQPGETFEVAAGDLLLAIEFRDANTGNPVRVLLDRVERARDLFNDMYAGKQADVDYYKTPCEYSCLVARGTEIKSVTVRAKRLLW